MNMGHKPARLHQTVLFHGADGAYQFAFVTGIVERHIMAPDAVAARYPDGFTVKQYLSLHVPGVKPDFEMVPPGNSSGHWSHLEHDATPSHPAVRIEVVDADGQPVPEVSMEAAMQAHRFFTAGR